jgi:hypothetical protein
VLRAPNGAMRTINTFALESGTALDGTYTSTGSLAASAPSGTYHVAGVVISDAMGNSASFLESQIRALGFATTFQIGGP